MARNRIEPAGDYKEYTSFSSEIDLTDTDESPIAAGHGAVVIRVVDVTAGTTLGVKMAAEPGTERTLTVAADEEIIGFFVAITDSTDVTRLRVGWPMTP